MGIAMNCLCVDCLLTKHMAIARRLGTEERAMAFAKAIMKEITDAPADANSDYMGWRINCLYCEFYGLPFDQLYQEKVDSNRFVMERLGNIRVKVENAPDPLFAALQFAVLGNYIDFSALYGQVSFDSLDAMLDTAQDIKLDMAAYTDLLADCEKGRKLLYVTDNAGEIVFDRVLAEQLQKRFPHLEITFCVRGGAAHNDALREDAQAAGITFPVIDNGCAVGGMPLDLIGQEAKAAMEEADVIITKGMGNVETLYGCGYNIYYAFLVKCPRFIQVFQKEKMTPMLMKELKQRGVESQ